MAAVHIKLWTTFNELLFILEASMKDIVERWASGKVSCHYKRSKTDVRKSALYFRQYHKSRGGVLKVLGPEHKVSVFFFSFRLLFIVYDFRCILPLPNLNVY